jgi:hypothetical protein
MNARSKARNNRDAAIGFRPSPLLRAAIVKWAERQGGRLTLSQVVCQLVESGLKVKEADRSGHRQGRRARRMAGETIDGMIATAVTADDKAARKRHLLDGPEEFSRVRTDRRKASRAADRGDQ